MVSNVTFTEGSFIATRLLSSQAMKTYGMGKQEMFASLWDEAGIMMKHLEEELTKSNIIDPSGFIERAIINVIASLVFGERLEYDDPQFLTILEVILDELFLYDTVAMRLFVDSSPVFKMAPKFLTKYSPALTRLYAFLDFIRLRLEQPRNLEKPSSVLDLLVIERKNNPNSEFNDPKVVGATVIDLFG